MKTPQVNDLAERRRQLKKKRRIKFYQRIWRSLVMVSFIGGTVWVARSPAWLLHSARQIEISDNQTLSDQNVRDLIPIAYPQTLLEVESDKLAQTLIEQAAIESARVSRRLLPPGLHVQITERQPVAIALPSQAQPLPSVPNQPFQEPGLIDAQGYWMPRDSFSKLGAEIAIPTFTVEGMRPGYAGTWQVIYHEIQRSPVKITAINWSDPNNLILRSELGLVHIGAYGDHFAAQLAALDQLRSLSQKVDLEQVAFIDLKDPKNPVIETLQAAGQSL
ncbi:cell division protein FtsQ/DivIB [Synechococcus sp. PCC 7335]|uniref:cell division protein FtsQ/DivIB n=1 Tax=Synechococcus sp. (strain ATCC 29403 / PCC 7335) TaxID=91464 RepID=UPI00031E9968|nr:FtsQ-type POTRA domain-containing protein [Synechococcus sp. PCC 7335]